MYANALRAKGMATKTQRKSSHFHVGFHHRTNFNLMAFWKVRFGECTLDGHFLSKQKLFLVVFVNWRGISGICCFWGNWKDFWGFGKLLWLND
jgi:hypothetical protein